MEEQTWRMCVLERLTAIQRLLTDIFETSKQYDEEKKTIRRYEADKARWELEREREKQEKAEKGGDPTPK